MGEKDLHSLKNGLLALCATEKAQKEFPKEMEKQYSFSQLQVQSDKLMERMNQDIARIARRRDCYWYGEWQDMGATVPQCSLAKMGECPCKGCENFLDKDEAHGVVMRYFVDKKKGAK